jgi:hypothetical protein
MRVKAKVGMSDCSPPKKARVGNHVSTLLRQGSPQASETQSDSHRDVATAGPSQSKRKRAMDDTELSNEGDESKNDAEDGPKASKRARAQETDPLEESSPNVTL